MSPLKGFYCPDGNKVELDDCFKECRMGERCQEEPDLHLMSHEREWSGVASTTQLINGTMLEFLKLTQPYCVDPDSRAFMIQGTKHHQELDAIAQELGLASEIAMSVDRDIFDLLVLRGKKICLVDRKLWGSFKVAQALGIMQVGRQPDPGGEVYKSSGKWGKAGTTKMVPLFQEVPDQADNYEAELQLNRYKIMLKEKTGMKVDEMYLRVVVRDGGLYIAYNRGVYKNTYRIPVAILDEEYVKDYFSTKDASLHEALAHGWDFPCTMQETWGGIRCERYCDVWDYCPQGIAKHKGG